MAELPNINRTNYDHMNDEDRLRSVVLHGPTGLRQPGSVLTVKDWNRIKRRFFDVADVFEPGTATLEDDVLTIAWPRLGWGMEGESWGDVALVAPDEDGQYHAWSIATLTRDGEREGVTLSWQEAWEDAPIDPVPGSTCGMAVCAHAGKQRTNLLGWRLTQEIAPDLGGGDDGGGGDPDDLPTRTKPYERTGSMLSRYLDDSGTLPSPEWRGRTTLNLCGFSRPKRRAILAEHRNLGFTDLCIMLANTDPTNGPSYDALRDHDLLRATLGDIRDVWPEARVYALLTADDTSLRSEPGLLDRMESVLPILREHGVEDISPGIESSEQDGFRRVWETETGNFLHARWSRPGEMVWAHNNGGLRPSLVEGWWDGILYQSAATTRAELRAEFAELLVEVHDHGPAVILNEANRIPIEDMPGALDGLPDWVLGHHVGVPPEGHDDGGDDDNGDNDGDDGGDDDVTEHLRHFSFRVSPEKTKGLRSKRLSLRDILTEEQYARIKPMRVTRIYSWIGCWPELLNECACGVHVDKHNVHEHSAHKHYRFTPPTEGGIVTSGHGGQGGTYRDEKETILPEPERFVFDPAENEMEFSFNQHKEHAEAHLTGEWPGGTDFRVVVRGVATD